jgi:hypothetical protein
MSMLTKSALTASAIGSSSLPRSIVRPRRPPRPPPETQSTAPLAPYRPGSLSLQSQEGSGGSLVRSTLLHRGARLSHGKALLSHWVPPPQRACPPAGCICRTQLPHTSVCAACSTHVAHCRHPHCARRRIECSSHSSAKSDNVGAACPCPQWLSLTAL